MNKSFCMQKKSVFFGYVDVLDNKIFTQKKANKWKRYLQESYKDIYYQFENEIDNDFPVQFFLNYSLLEEVVADAIIGLRKVAYSPNNSVEEPNSFKVAAYLTYWWLRHKPVSTHFPEGYRLENVDLKNNTDLSEEELNERQKIMAWRLKHINECVAVNFALTFIFDFDSVVCSNKEFKKIKKHDGENLAFESFNEMQKVMIDKFLYYLSYRAIAPKVIEHLLEAFTIHPIWKLTGNHWKV